MPEQRSVGTAGVIGLLRTTGPSGPLAILAEVAAVAAAIVIAWTAIAGRPITWAPVLLVVGAPLLAIGQVYVLVILIGRSGAEHGELLQVRRTGPKGLRLRDVRGGLPTPVAIAFLVTFWTFGLVGIWTSTGLPPSGTAPQPGQVCEFEWTDHGRVTCLTQQEHDAASAATQRFAACVLGGFFVLHSGIALSETTLRLRKVSPPA